MTKEEVKQLLPILVAFAEGKAIECRTKPGTISSCIPNEWTEMKEIGFWDGIEYRIKPEPKYRPFKNAEECWQEMQKHQPFGWLMGKEQNARTEINYIHNDGVILGCGPAPFKYMFGIYTFADGIPFGIKVEE